MPLEYYDENDLMFGPRDFFIDHYGDGSKIIVGHLPTRLICGAIPDQMFHAKDPTAIDWGGGSAGRLGALRLDDMEEMCF